MDTKKELEKFKKIINSMSEKEFDELLVKCGIDVIPPSVKSEYVKCVRNSFGETSYEKNSKYKSNDKYNYFSLTGLDVGQGVA